MKNKQPIDLTDIELLAEKRKKKSAYTTFSFIIGMMAGIAIYSTVKNGFGFFTLFPIFFLPLAIVNWTSYKAVDKEVKNRNLK